MRKTYVLDTNVLLHDPTAYLEFEENIVVIPLCVLSEIDKFKRELTERGKNARTVARSLDKIRLGGSLSEGVQTPGGGKLMVVFPLDSNPLFTKMPPDDQILLTAKQIKDNDTSKICIVISKDITLRLKADSIGLQAEDYENGHAKDTAETYMGYSEIKVPSEFIDDFEINQSIILPDAELNANQYVNLIAFDCEKKSALARFDLESGNLVPLLQIPQTFGPIKPRNRGQRFAMDALLNDKIPLVTIEGKAGTGKTLLALAAAVYKTKRKAYKKILVSRPVFPMGKDLGFLPGDINEKFAPWIQPIYDALEVIENSSSKKSEDIKSSGMIEVEPLTYIRGRSIPRQFIIVDECQNLTPLEIKTVLTRAGAGTKIVLTGDIYQIDNPYVDAMSNGINAVAERFKNEPMAAHICLEKGERSKLAELASNLL